MALRNWLPSVQRLRSRLSHHELRLRLMNDPYYRLQSVEEIAVAAALGIAINVNRAGVDDWLRLPGLSIHQARSLVKLCQAGVQFYCLEDIAAALDVASQRLQPLEPVLSFHYYDECHQALVNPNTATVDMLARVPSVEIALATAIVQNRLLAGPYRNLVDFQQRLSLPGDLTAQLMHCLRF